VNSPPYLVIPTAAPQNFVIPTEAKRSGGICISSTRPQRPEICHPHRSEAQEKTPQNLVIPTAAKRSGGTCISKTSRTALS